jgi:hypothetical protein
MSPQTWHRAIRRRPPAIVRPCAASEQSWPGSASGRAPDSSARAYHGEVSTGQASAAASRGAEHRRADLPMTGRRVRAYARVVILPAAPDLGLLLVRTDYSDDLAWYAALSAATAVYDTDDFERVGALLLPVESLPCRASGPPAGSTFTPGLPQPDRGSGRADDA